jgi:4'-phosphopantetheinyl transferase
VLYYGKSQHVGYWINVDPIYQLQTGQVHVWLFELKAAQDQPTWQRYESLLDFEERTRLQRFALQSLRTEYLVSHALTRLILARYEGAAPEALLLARNPFGRPELSHSRLGLRFNLSHAKGLGALAITTAWDIGVDVECEDRPISPLEIAEHYFAPAELDWLRRQPPGDRKGRFVDLWSLKEAYIKARGLGLSLALDQFAIDLSDRNRPGLSFGAGSEDDPNDWKLFLFRPKANSALGVAIRCGARGEPELVTFDLTSALEPIYPDQAQLAARPRCRVRRRRCRRPLP